MSGAQIAADAKAAIIEVAREVGRGKFRAFIIRKTGEPTNPWDTDGATTTTYTVPCIDLGMQKIIDDATLLQRMARVIMISAEGLVPLVSDKVNVGGREYAVLKVMPEATGGVDLYYKIAIEGGVLTEGVEGIAPPELIAPPEGQDW